MPVVPRRAALPLPSAWAWGAPPTSRSNNCQTLIKLVRENARFALKVTDTSERLPFGKEMKIMAGGLAGLKSVIRRQVEKQPGQPDIRDIHDLVQEAQATFGSLTALPYPEIMKSVAAFRLRKRWRAS